MLEEQTGIWKWDVQNSSIVYRQHLATWWLMTARWLLPCPLSTSVMACAFYSLLPVTPTSFICKHRREETNTCSNLAVATAFLVCELFIYLAFKTVVWFCFIFLLWKQQTSEMVPTLYSFLWPGTDTILITCIIAAAWCTVQLARNWHTWNPQQTEHPTYGCLSRVKFAMQLEHFRFYISWQLQLSTILKPAALVRAAHKNTKIQGIEKEAWS